MSSFARLRVLLPAAAMSLLLAACATPIPPTDVGGGPGICKPEAARWAIGRSPSADVVERARVESGSRSVRVLEPGTAATMDYREDRLNIDVNERGAITGLRCG
ncbi:I78 family peptidase inhibitor [Lysobacter firmicutimachus]|uniref:I78 family peptidase inhibitor n=1 Tax=Lysobacter firmicutimachus TaxID=1792846 RepID=A0AAU8MZL7_9GAMM|nr:I78 family peptidase inhibitor [Lysobacter antibioticus]